MPWKPRELRQNFFNKSRLGKAEAAPITKLFNNSFKSLLKRIHETRTSRKRDIWRLVKQQRHASLKTSVWVSICVARSPPNEHHESGKVDLRHDGSSFLPATLPCLLTEDVKATSIVDMRISMRKPKYVAQSCPPAQTLLDHLQKQRQQTEPVLASGYSSKGALRHPLCFDCLNAGQQDLVKTTPRHACTLYLAFYALHDDSILRNIP
jgi:hypothetical protein